MARAILDGKHDVTIIKINKRTCMIKDKSSEIFNVSSNRITLIDEYYDGPGIILAIAIVLMIITAFIFVWQMVKFII